MSRPDQDDEDEERDRRLHEHLAAADAAIKQVRDSIAGAKRELRLPLAKSTRLEPINDRDPVA